MKERSKNKLLIGTVLGFSIIAILLNLATAICNSIGYYKIIALNKDLTYYKFMGMNYSEWSMRGQQFYGIHGIVCLTFVFAFVVLFLLKKFSAKEYVLGILFFYLVQVCIAALFELCFDPARMSVAIENLAWIPYRPQRWMCTIILGIVGVVMDKEKNTSQYSRSF